MDTTSIDNAAAQMETRGFFIRKKGSDGFQFGYKPTLKKVVNDRRSSLDEDEIRMEARKIIQGEFERGKALPVISFPEDGSAVPDTTKLSLIVLEPDHEWTESAHLLRTVAEWTRKRGNSDRLYPGALIWCIRKEGRDLHAKIETLLAWGRVNRDFRDGTLSGDFDRGDVEEIETRLRDAKDAAIDEVWASYRYLALYDPGTDSGLKVIDLGAGHSNSGETLTGRVIATLKAQGLLNDSPGAGYIERKWPKHFRESGAWPLSALRQAFLSGAMGRLLDPDSYLKTRVPQFVMAGDFGYASGSRSVGYSQVWFGEMLPAEEISFDPDVYLLLPAAARPLKSRSAVAPEAGTPDNPIATAASAPAAAPPLFAPADDRKSSAPAAVEPGRKTLILRGEIPTEIWNRLGRTLIPKLKSAGDLNVGLSFSVEIDTCAASALAQEIDQILRDLALGGSVRVDVR